MLHWVGSGCARTYKHSSAEAVFLPSCVDDGVTTHNLSLIATLHFWWAKGKEFDPLHVPYKMVELQAWTWKSVQNKEGSKAPSFWTHVRVQILFPSWPTKLELQPWGDGILSVGNVRTWQYSYCWRTVSSIMCWWGCNTQLWAQLQDCKQVWWAKGNESDPLTCA